MFLLCHYFCYLFLPLPLLKLLLSPCNREVPYVTKNENGLGSPHPVPWSPAGRGLPVCSLNSWWFEGRQRNRIALIKCRWSLVLGCPWAFCLTVASARCQRPRGLYVRLSVGPFGTASPVCVCLINFVLFLFYSSSDRKSLVSPLACPCTLTAQLIRRS